MDRALAEELAASYRKFCEWFNAMTELTAKFEDATQGKRLRQMLSTCFVDLEDEIYRELRKEHPDLFVYGDIEQLRDIAWSLWNPLGLSPSQALRNQYDRYLQEASEIVAAGQSQECLERYLADIAKAKLGLKTYSAEMATPAAQAIVKHVKLHLG